MSRKEKISALEKIRAVESYLHNEISINSLANKFDVSWTSIEKWIIIYRTYGHDGLITPSKKSIYSDELKHNAVNEYLNGSASLKDIAFKYGLRSKSQLHQWVLKYNSHEELKASKTGGTTIMINGRKTTYAERIEIIKYCIEHQNNYAETAQKFQVSYQQVYTWTSKYENDGVEALLDKRGRRKSEIEMSELEKLKAQNKLLEAKNRRQQMEIDFLKKLDEIERRRF